MVAKMVACDFKDTNARYASAQCKTGAVRFCEKPRFF